MRTYSLKNADQWLSFVAIAMKGAAKRGLLSAAHRAVGNIKTEIIPSIHPEPTNKGTAKAGWIAIETPEGAAIVNTVLQAVLMEEGVRPENVKIGRKLIDALTEWVKAKGLGYTHMVINEKGERKISKVSDIDARQMAWAIAQSMKKHGIFNKGRGWGILARVEKEIPRFIREEVAREMKREFE